jgi:Icc-related predicted phosphoesterase
MMRIVAFGDIHMEWGMIDSIPALDSADLVIVTGDFTNFGGRRQASQVLDALQAVNANVLAVPGNLDQPEVEGFLAGRGVSLHGRGRELHGVALVGVGGSNVTPFKTPMEFSEEEIAALIQSGHKEVEGGKPLILVSHTPPVDTKCDTITGGIHVGSSAVRRYIEENRPALCLTGHIHEAKSQDRIGDTQILNPGMLRDGGWIEVIYEDNSITALIQG